jgi:hypothetical protein
MVETDMKIAMTTLNDLVRSTLILPGRTDLTAELDKRQCGQNKPSTASAL